MNPELPILLLTRPAPQARRFAEAARDRCGAGLRIVLSPLMAPELLNPDLPLQGLRGLIFTSETGVEGFARLSGRRDLPAHCVGEATARAARDAGFAVATIGPGTAAALADLLAGAVEGPLLWPRGAEAAVDIAARLDAAGLPVRAATVYRQAPCPATPEAVSALAGSAPVILPLFSARSALLAAAAWPARQAPLFVAAISPAVAQAAARLAPDRMIPAARPDAEAMLEATVALLAAAQPG